jgi:hypothetical protein
MDIVVQRILAYGVLGLLLATLAAWMHINGKDGSGWGLLAFCMFVASCNQEPY